MLWVQYGWHSFANAFICCLPLLDFTIMSIMHFYSPGRTDSRYCLVGASSQMP